MPLFDNYDDRITDKTLQALEADKEYQDLVTPTKLSSPSSSTGGTANQPAAAPAEAPKKEETDKPLEDKAGDALRNVAEGALAAPAGLLDFGVDLVNMLPKKDLPGVANPFGTGPRQKLPAFKNDTLQSLREAVSIIGPTILLTRAGLKGGAATQAALGPKLGALGKLGSDIIFKKFAELGIAAGAGAAVDYIAKPNQTEHNAAGSLKQMWPKTFSWISEDWATVDGDSPEVFREKNVKEGVGIGIITDIGVEAARLIRAFERTKSITKWLPKDAKSKAYFDKLKSADDSDAISKGVVGRESALDELGDYRYINPENLNQPTLGLHDMFDEVESGIRTLDDGGVAGAMGDAARIRNNVYSNYGRLRNFISEAAMKNGINADNLTKRTIVDGVKEMISQTGKFDYLVGNKLLTQADIEEAGTDLARIWLDADLDLDQFKAVVEPFRRNVAEGVKSLDDVGYRAVMETMKEHLDRYVSLDSMKAAGLTTTQKAGQLADTATGARLMEGTASIERAQEQILDIMEFLMVEKGVSSYMRGRGLANIGFWNRVKNTIAGKDAAESALDEFNKNLNGIIDEAKAMTTGLREISDKRPEFLVPLNLAYELTDGDVNSIAKLNNYVNQSLPNIQKAFVDNQPEIPNLIVQGLWSNIFNSALSAIATTGKAFWGNASMLMVKPLATFAGAASTGDIKTIKRAWYGYSALFDSTAKGFEHMGRVFWKASTDPTAIQSLTRSDLVIKHTNQWKVLDEFAKAASKSGNDGPAVLLEHARTLEDMANHPVIRFGTNGITATDGFGRAVMANVEARTQVYDKLIQKGTKLSPEELKKASDEIFQSMIDKKTGLLKEDQHIKYAVDEIALNLDNAFSKSLGSMIQQFPLMRPFMMFPRASTNLIAFADKFSPYSLFLKEYNQLAYKNINEFGIDEIQAILKQKGIPFDSSAPDRFATLVAEAKGRKAIGTSIMFMAGGMFMNDRLTGDGFYDKQVQKTREGLGWKKRHYKDWNGEWKSYENLGPLSDLIAAVATTMDHFDTLDPPSVEQYFQKASFVLATIFLDKSMLTGAEAMLDILRGNPAAANRWAAGFTNNMLPLGGMRAEFGRNISDGLRELDMDFMQLMRNRNNWLDIVDPNGALPYKYSWLDGEKVSPGGGNFFARAWNATSIMKVSGSKISPEAQFLLDIEYDNRPSFITDDKGSELDPQTRALLYEAVGKQGYFKAAIRREMNSLDAKGFREKLLKARESGEVDKTQFNDLYNRLDKEMANAKKYAMTILPEDVTDKLYEQQALKNLNKNNNKYGLPGFPLKNI